MDGNNNNPRGRMFVSQIKDHPPNIIFAQAICCWIEWLVLEN